MWIICEMLPAKNLKKFYKEKPVCVAGGSGFIGSLLVARLSDLGARVTVLTRSWENPWRLKELKKKIRIMRADMTDLEATRRAVAIASPRIMFNLTGDTNTERSLSRLHAAIENNFITARNLMASAAEREVEKFIQVGTIEEYGVGKAPFKESQQEMPVSPYSFSKTMATHLALLYQRSKGFRGCVVRPAATFGPKQGFGMLIPNMIRACLEGKEFRMNPGEQVRDFIFVEDLTEGFLAAGSNDAASGEIINIGGGRGHKVKTIVNMINEIMGNSIVVRFGAESYRSMDSMRFFMDTKKATRLLHWKAKTDIKEALRKTVNWYKENYDIMPK